jgi:hypothetical protein
MPGFAWLGRDTGHQISPRVGRTEPPAQRASCSPDAERVETMWRWALMTARLATCLDEQGAAAQDIGQTTERND